ncbi:MAG: SUMF1/EgtB/PvdO family nonheme iron enzyme [Chitinophagaceae bacterium]|nr:SUMF1/EgtB/PvdO family nonheme iron enzyme [Chitinophagaceae bacterium]
MKQIFSFIILLFIAFHSNANNVATSAVTLGPQNAASNFTMINYDISWENSWRTSTNESNYDGVWLFVKFRKNNTTNWQHATINYVAPGTAAACGHTQAAGSLIKTSADGKGIWQYRDADGVGAVFFAANSLRWNYGVDGVLDNDSVEVRVFAVEMVNIPQGAFALGSGSTTEANRFRNGASDTYMNITSEAAITVGLGAANIFGYGNSNMAAGSIPAAYPKGYNAFWIMKYELSQQSYVDFLNTIDFAAAVDRNMGYTGVHPNITATNPEWAADAVGTTDLLSWLDWAAMRPFTEFEYEKACRGANILPVANEYAWGNTNLIHINGIQNAGTASESFTSGHCNYSSGILNRPMRCGAVATITSNRMQSGASYYGVMELSGNVNERAIAAGYTEGRAFTGLHGNGNLNVTHTYDVANWPVIATGSGLTFRGGGYQVNGNIQYLQTSERTSATSVNVSRSATYGGRGARTAE